MKKAEPQHNQAQTQPAARQGSGASFESPQGEQIAQLEAMMESSPQAEKHAQLGAMIDASPAMSAQRKLADMIHNSPRQIAQKKAFDATHNSTRQVAQRKMFKNLLGGTAQRTESAEAPVVVQRVVNVGGAEMSLAALRTEVMRRHNLTAREARHVLRNADGKQWNSWSMLGIWVALGLELMEMDEDKEGEFSVDRTHSHTFETHTIAGIWAARRVLTAHPNRVAIFLPGNDQGAIAAMPDRFTAWKQEDADRWDAEVGGVHYQADWDPDHRVMRLRTCYPVANGIDLPRGDVEKALEMAQSGAEFNDLIMGLHRNDMLTTAQVRAYVPRVNDWFAARMGGSNDSKDGGKSDEKKGGGK